MLWQRGDPLAHRLLRNIGPEPFSGDFDGAALHRATRNRSAAIKLVLMDSHVVAGVGISNNAGEIDIYLNPYVASLQQ